MVKESKKHLTIIMLEISVRALKKDLDKLNTRIMIHSKEIGLKIKN